MNKRTVYYRNGKTQEVHHVDAMELVRQGDARLVPWGSSTSKEEQNLADRELLLIPANRLTDDQIIRVARLRGMTIRPDESISDIRDRIHELNVAEAGGTVSAAAPSSPLSAAADEDSQAELVEE